VVPVDIFVIGDGQAKANQRESCMQTSLLGQSCRQLRVDVVTVAALAIRPPLQRKAFLGEPEDLEELGSFSSFLLTAKRG